VAAATAKAADWAGGREQSTDNARQRARSEAIHATTVIEDAAPHPPEARRPPSISDRDDERRVRRSTMRLA